MCIVIPVRNGGDDLRECLRAVRRLDPRPAGVTVVNDNSTDGSGDVARGAGATVFRVDGPGGPSVARNVGARSTFCEVVLFVDADVAVHPDVVGRVQDEFARDPSLAALIGSYDDAPPKPNFLSQYRNLLHHYVHQRGGEEAFTFWGACGAIRRDVFEQLGGFDETWTCIEDIELGYRLRAAGHRIKLVKALQVKHLKRWTLTSLLRTDIFVRALPWSRLIIAHKHMANDLNIDVASRLSVMCVFGLIGSLFFAILWPPVLVVAGLCLVGLLVLNAHLYVFLARKRGLFFALRAMPWHWLYYLYSGAAFGVATIEHLFRRAPGGSPVSSELSHAEAR
ncbi:MAG: glycosyltransferase [Tepidisphaeraceae bacterium]